jgi:hypothetical protein
LQFLAWWNLRSAAPSAGKPRTAIIPGQHADAGYSTGQLADAIIAIFLDGFSARPAASAPSRSIARSTTL